MLRKYARILIVSSLLVMALTTSGCYTVLKMRSGTVDYAHYAYDEYDDVYDECYDPFYSYYPNPYYYYSYAQTSSA